jgi:hypothetical protein
VTPLVFQPRARTALLDAIGRTIIATGALLSAKPDHERPEHVIFVILTDGQENASREFSLGQIKDMIQHQTNQYKWHFVYLGANQDAIVVAQNMGVRGAAAMTINTADLEAYGSSFSSLSSNTRSLREKFKANMDWMEKQRKDSAGTTPKQ